MKTVIAIAILAVLATAPAAMAQTATQAKTSTVLQLGSSTGGFEKGYDGAASVMTDNFNPSTRDANNNRVITNGVIQTGSGGSSFLSGGGASTAQSGASALAVGNMINVQVTGSWNTVVLNAQQTNTGNVSASVNGRNSTGQLN